MKMYKTLVQWEEGKYLTPAVAFVYYMNKDDVKWMKLWTMHESKYNPWTLPYEFHADALPKFVNDGQELICRERGQFMTCEATPEAALQMAKDVIRKMHSKESWKVSDMKPYPNFTFVTVEVEIDQPRWYMGDSAGVWASDVLVTDHIIAMSK